MASMLGKPCSLYSRYDLLSCFLYSFGSCFYLMLSVHGFPGNLNHYVGVVSIMLYCSGYRITCLPSKLNVCCSFKKVLKVKYETELQTWWLFPNRFGWSSVKNLCCSFHVFDTYFFYLFCTEPDRQTEGVLHRFGSDGHDHCRLPAWYRPQRHK